MSNTSDIKNFIEENINYFEDESVKKFIYDTFGKSKADMFYKLIEQKKNEYR